jgi:hypothetical protein
MQPEPAAPRRRDLMRQAACVAGAWAASGALPLVAYGEVQPYPRSLLVDAKGRPFAARQLKKASTFLFNYPFTATPVFLFAFAEEVKPPSSRPRTSGATPRPAASARSDRSSPSRRSARTS